MATNDTPREQHDVRPPLPSYRPSETEKAMMARQQGRGKRESNKRARKEAIYQVAMELFRRQGFDATRVEEITQAAGVAKGTFFNYFPTKEDVLLYIGERHVTRLGAALANGSGRRITQSQSATTALRLFMHTLADSLAEDRELVRLAVNKAMKMSHLAPVSPSRFGFRSLVAILVARGQRTGELHPDLEPELVAEVLEGLYYQQLAIWCQQDFAFDLGDRLEQVVDLLVHGIGARRL